MPYFVLFVCYSDLCLGRTYISDPMDLGTITERVVDGYYSNKDDVNAFPSVSVLGFYVSEFYDPSRMYVWCGTTARSSTWTTVYCIRMLSCKQ